MKKYIDLIFFHVIKHQAMIADIKTLDHSVQIMFIIKKNFQLLFKSFQLLYNIKKSNTMKYQLLLAFLVISYSQVLTVSQNGHPDVSLMTPQANPPVSGTPLLAVKPLSKRLQYLKKEAAVGSAKVNKFNAAKDMKEINIKSQEQSLNKQIQKYNNVVSNKVVQAQVQKRVQAWNKNKVSLEKQIRSNVSLIQNSTQKVIEIIRNETSLNNSANSSAPKGEGKSRNHVWGSRPGWKNKQHDISNTTNNTIATNTSNASRMDTLPEKLIPGKLLNKKKWIVVSDGPAVPPACTSNAECLKKFPQATYVNVKLTCNLKSNKCEINQ